MVLVLFRSCYDYALPESSTGYMHVCSSSTTQAEQGRDRGRRAAAGLGLIYSDCTFLRALFTGEWKVKGLKSRRNIDTCFWLNITCCESEIWGWQSYSFLTVQCRNKTCQLSISTPGNRSRIVASALWVYTHPLSPFLCQIQWYLTVKRCPCSLLLGWSDTLVRVDPYTTLATLRGRVPWVEIDHKYRRWLYIQESSFYDSS